MGQIKKRRREGLRKLAELHLGVDGPVTSLWRLKRSLTSRPPHHRFPSNFSQPSGPITNRPDQGGGDLTSYQYLFHCLWALELYELWEGLEKSKKKKALLLCVILQSQKNGDVSHTEPDMTLQMKGEYTVTAETPRTSCTCNMLCLEFSAQP